MVTFVKCPEVFSTKLQLTIFMSCTKGKFRVSFKIKMHNFHIFKHINLFFFFDKKLNPPLENCISYRPAESIRKGCPLLASCKTIRSNYILPMHIYKQLWHWLTSLEVKTGYHFCIASQITMYIYKEFTHSQLQVNTEHNITMFDTTLF